LTCRWQRHSVKPSCWKCSTAVEQAETQLRVVVPIGEEDMYSQNTTILVRSGTVRINNYMFRPLYWPSSCLYSTLISNHKTFAVYMEGRDLVYNSLVV
jgi:hypothetical protein